MTETISSPPAAPRDVHVLLHFGWACAELRGRYRQLLTSCPEPAPEAGQPRCEYTLPLNQERSAAELAIQSEKEVASLATDLGLDAKVSSLPYPPPDATDGTVVSYIRGLCTKAVKAEDQEQRGAWMHLANIFHEWDTMVQDTLAPASATESAAYQLGRGLAEAYWSLDPNIADSDARSWPSLLGPARAAALQRFMVQLTPAYDVMTAAAVHGSLETWQEIATTPQRRTHHAAVSTLHEQVRNWHMLLVESVSADSFLTIHRLLAAHGSTWSIIRAFWGPAVLAALGLLAAAIAIVLLTAYKATAPVSAGLAVLGLFGVTVAGALAKAKDAATASLAHMRDAANRALVAQAATAVPEETRRWQWRSPLVRAAQGVEPPTAPKITATQPDPPEIASD